MCIRDSLNILPFNIGIIKFMASFLDLIKKICASSCSLLSSFMGQKKSAAPNEELKHLKAAHENQADANEDWDDFQSWDKPRNSQEKKVTVVTIPEKRKKGVEFDEKLILSKKNIIDDRSDDLFGDVNSGPSPVSQNATKADDSVSMRVKGGGWTEDLDVVIQ
eukprot:TRINITY_DN3490_c0_g1_i1.p2 TRINITY_DN3490_c0_g1~~TRINITY_DN3490_c0_g1_i1.p2  ORF type:complete len:163 (-),score=45.73 TRINITY_DN3490_c0_g1_i1:93-581(-)